MLAEVPLGGKANRGWEQAVKSITRCGDMNWMFSRGESRLLNCIARLSVLYEDFRVEHTALGEIAALSDKDGPRDRYRFLYLVVDPP